MSPFICVNSTTARTCLKPAVRSITRLLSAEVRLSAFIFDLNRRFPSSAAGYYPQRTFLHSVKPYNRHKSQACARHMSKQSSRTGANVRKMCGKKKQAPVCCQCSLRLGICCTAARIRCKEAPTSGEYYQEICQHYPRLARGNWQYPRR